MNLRPNPFFLKELKSFTNLLEANETQISIRDLGAGSRYFGNERRIRDIYKISSSKGKYGILLHQLALHYRPRRILEFGTSLGVGTFHLSNGSPRAEIVTIEACPQTQQVAVSQFKKFKNKNIQSVNSTFNEFLDQYVGPKFDLVFVDGHHDGDALMAYMGRLKSITHSDTIFVLDDIRWSQSMLNAFEKLSKSDVYHVSMDLFRVGILVPRPQQVKEHFIVKI